MQIRNPDSNDFVELIGQISAAFGYNKDEAGVARDFPLSSW